MLLASVRPLCRCMCLWWCQPLVGVSTGSVSLCWAVSAGVLYVLVMLSACSVGLCDGIAVGLVRAVLSVYGLVMLRSLSLLGKRGSFPLSRLFFRDNGFTSARPRCHGHRRGYYSFRTIQSVSSGAWRPHFSLCPPPGYRFLIVFTPDTFSFSDLSSADIALSSFRFGCFPRDC